MTTQSIVTPFGISVHGSATISVAPDFAVLTFSVSHFEEHPRDAFQAVRLSAQRVQAYLAAANITDAGSSRIRLTEELRHRSTGPKSIGYQTRVDFRVVLSDLNRTEEVIIGIIDTGVNNIHSIDFQTKRLKEIHDEASQQALQDARQKAETYCVTAGIELGEIIHIEDLNPIFQQGSQRLVGGTSLGGNESQSFEAGNIVVVANVIVAFKIQGR